MQKQSNTILFASPVSDFRGGAERSMFELVINTKMHGYNPIVIVPRKGEISRELRRNGIKTYTVNYDWWARIATDIHPTFQDHRSTNGQAVLKILQIIESESPFITVSYTAVFPWLAYASSITHTPHIWQLCEILSDNAQWKLRLTLQATMSVIDIMSVKVFANSKTCLEKSVPFLPSHSSSIEVIYPYVDQIKARAESEIKPLIIIPDNRPVVSIVGNIQPSKGQLDAVMAISEVKKSGIENILLLIIGNELDKDYLDNIKKLVRKKSLEENVIFTGYTHNPHVYVKMSDVALVCSTHEAFGRITVEAMSIGTPVIGLDSDGTAEIIGHTGKYGLLYPPGDIETLSKQIRKLLLNPNTRTNISHAAQSYVQERFTIDKNQLPFFEFIKDFRVQEPVKDAPFADIVTAYKEVVRIKSSEVKNLKNENSALRSQLSDIVNSKKYILATKAGRALHAFRRPK